MRSRLLSRSLTRKRCKRQLDLLSVPGSLSVAQAQTCNALFDAVSQDYLDKPCPCHQSSRPLTTNANRRRNVSPNAKISRDKSGEHTKATQRLIHAPLGSFDSKVWYEAEWTMRYWNRQRTIKSVYAALDLTDRFLKEYSFQQTKQQQAMKRLPPVLTTASLNFTLHNWQACSKSLKSPQLIAKLPSPTNMLATVDYFRDYYRQNNQQQQPAISGRPLQPSIESYSMIIDAMAFAQLFVLQSEYEVFQDQNVANNKAAAPDEYGNVGWHFTTTPAPVIAETLLNRLVQESEINTHLRPSIITFNSVINAWARSRHPEAPQKAEEILRTIQNLSTIPGWKDLKPTSSTYGSIIHTWANSNSSIAAERAEQLVEEMINDNIPVNGEIHLGVIKAWHSSMDPQAAERAMERLEGMIAAYRAARGGKQGTADAAANNLLKPPMNCFLAVMNIYAKQGDPKGATAVLEQLQDLYETSGRDADLCPNTAVFNCLLRAWSRSRSSDAYAQTEKLLQRQRELSETTGNVKLMPDTVSYNTVLHALSRSLDPNALQRAEELFSAMEKSPGNKPDLISYNVMLHLIARSQQDDAAERAEATLRQMWDMHSSKVIDFMPDTTSYNTCIDAWKNRNDPHRAEALFQELQDRYSQTGFGTLKPTRVSYGSLITAWARSRRTGSAEKAQQIFDAMIAAGIRPTTIEYNSTIHAWASVGKVDRAESLLDRSLEDYTKGNKRAKPDVKSFSSLLNAIAKRKSPDPWSDAKHGEAILMRMEELSEFLGMGVKPNIWSFNIVLDCFARCRKNEAAPKHAERILRHMQALSESGNHNLRPTVISYTTVMNCWVQSHSEETAGRVQKLFDDLKAQYEATGDRSLKPSQFTYNALIGAYARDTRHANSLDMAMKHFNNMVEQYEHTKSLDLRPGPMHFSVIMSALSRRGMADDAEHFLQRILTLCREYYVSDGEKLEISSSFNGLIGAQARSKLPGSAERAEMTLRRMQDLGPDSEYVVAPPNVFSYTSVMMAWSFVSDPESKEEAVTRCEELLQEMLEHARNGDRSILPNNFTFGTLLQVISRSDLPQKNEHAEQVVEIMKQNRIKPDNFVRKMLAACLT